MTARRVTAGTRLPHGACPDERGVNFSVWSRHATRVELLLFGDPDAPEPSAVIPLDPDVHRTHFTWHAHVEGLGPGTCWAWRMDGPDDTADSGRRFNALKDLADPFARVVSTRLHDRILAADPDVPGTHGPRAIVASPLPGEADTPRPLSLEGAVIYELHVGNFTSHESADVRHPGTFAGLAEKIPYLRDLGITHVELLPVAAFDEDDVPEGTRALGLRNTWGYSPHSLFAPHPRYLVRPDAPDAALEFRDMVDAFHAAGIGVILDVVLNHTAEGGDDGPWISFKGICNEVFYHLDPEDRRRYLDFTGCGNTINCNYPIVADILVEALEWWAGALRVDGFRVDLASVLTRGDGGVPLANPPLPWQIELSRILKDHVLIAEPWDAVGLSHEGRFPGQRWAEWNARYRDAMRFFARGDSGLAGEAAACLSGSAELFGASGRGPSRSINFITSHDGFTLFDVVSYSRKHDLANGEENRDGRNDEPCWNNGVEGETDDPAIRALRHRDARNLMAMLLLSLGTPMILGGDEVLRTQRGNNNAWCQDNEIAWMDWRLVSENADFLRFTREMIALRRRHPLLQRDHYLTGLHGIEDLPDVAWHGERLGEPPWLGGDPGILAFTMAAHEEDEEHLHAVLNMSSRDVAIDLPPIASHRWFLAVDTSRDSPHDVVPRERQQPAPGDLAAPARSVLVFESRLQA